MPDASALPNPSLSTRRLGSAPAAGIERALAAVQGASASIEAHFVEAGHRLESASGLLDGLAATFAAVRDELEGAALRRAADDLSRTAGGVSAVAAAHRDEQATLTRVGTLAGEIDRRVQPMRKAIKAVEVLAINARIAAAAIGSTSGDFNSFISELGRPLRAARESLDRFSAELDELDERARSAGAASVQFAQRQSAAVDTVPRRLTASVEAIAVHGRHAAAAATAIGDTSQQVRERIATAVMALQIGDSTRQRIEHVAEALILLLDQHPSAWSNLDERAYRGLAATVFRLQAAQLRDTADDLTREADRIAAVLGELGVSARAIAGLGQDAYAASDGGGRTFVGELVEQVGQVTALLSGFADARAAVHRVMTTVLEGAERLLGHIHTITSLEADLRIMGLNTTLKCARLGAAGRPLSVIAQELRVYANQTAEEATAIVTDLRDVMRLAESLGGGTGSERDGGALAAVMTASVAQLEAAERRLTAALAELERDSGAVAGLLVETNARFAESRALGLTLHQVADDLAALADDQARDSEPADAAQAALLAMIERRYTMARERTIHDVVVMGRVAPAIEQVAATSIDDMLF